jgi:parvulin-like peptidyl-prolyl isomerase
MAKGSKQKVITKKHLARLERERRQRRYIIITSIVVVVLVVGFIGYGILDRLVIQPLQPVATVNGAKITTKDWQAHVRYARQGIIQQYIQTAQLAQAFGSDPSTAQYFQNSLQQIASQLDDPNTIGNQVLNTMIQDELIKAEATVRGLTVSDADLDKALQDDFGYYPNGTPTPTPATPTQVEPTLNATQVAIITPTPTLTPTVTATLTATPVITITYTPTVIPSPTQVPTPTLTPTPYTEQAYQTNLKEAYDNINKNLQIDQATFREIVRAQLLRKKVSDAITADVPHSVDEVWTRQIVVTDTVTADQVIQLLKSGQDFAALAKTYSTDVTTKDNGGDKGWLPRTSMDAAVADAAFALKNPGDTSSPIKGTSGIYIIQLVGHEVRQLASADYDNQAQQKFNDWLTSQRTAANVKIYDYWQQRVPLVPTLPAGSSATGTGQ